MIQLKTLIAVAFLMLANLAFADETPWPVPADQDSKTAPAMFDEASKKAGEEIYLKNCKSCHGDVGKANMIALNPLPKDLATVGGQTDGSFHYKIVNGRGPMPAFKNILSANDVWHVISYIRSFHSGYVQPQPSAGGAFGGSAVKLAIEYLASENLVKVTAVGQKDNEKIPAEGVEINLFVKRYFGQLKVADPATTNQQGVAFFNLGKALPGNEQGELNFLAKVTDTEKYGEAKADTVFKAGTPTHKPGLTEQRAMWNVRAKAPVWLVLAYSLVTLGVLATIGYVALLLKKIFELGKENTESKN